MAVIFIGLLVGLICVGVFFGYKFYKKKDAEVEEVEEKYIPTTQDHLALDYIRSGIVRLKNGGYRLLLEIPSVNIELMEGEEREGVLQQYRQILNAMEFPFQFLQQSRIVDVSEYISKLNGFSKAEKNPLIKKQTEYYTEFVEELIRDRSVLTKKFYLVVPYDEEKELKNKSGYQAEKERRKQKELAKNKKNAQQAEEEDEVFLEEKRFEKARKMLYSRGLMIEKAFRRFEISPKILDDQELLELFYTAYNKDRSVIQSLRNADINDFTTLRVKEKRRN